jgi:hypothetical protein
MQVLQHHLNESEVLVPLVLLWEVLLKVLERY